MQPFKLTKTQYRNLLSCQEDLDMIDLEIERAKKAGATIDPQLIVSCEDCRKRVYDLLNTYNAKTTERVIV